MDIVHVVWTLSIEHKCKTKAIHKWKDFLLELSKKIFAFDASLEFAEITTKPIYLTEHMNDRVTASLIMKFSVEIWIHFNHQE